MPPPVAVGGSTGISISQMDWLQSIPPPWGGGGTTVPAINRQEATLEPAEVILCSLCVIIRGITQNTSFHWIKHRSDPHSHAYAHAHTNMYAGCCGHRKKKTLNWGCLVGLYGWEKCCFHTSNVRNGGGMVRSHRGLPTSLLFLNTGIQRCPFPCCSPSSLKGTWHAPCACA